MSTQSTDEGIENADCISAEGKTSFHPNVYPGYDTKLADDEVPVLELWAMWITPSLPLLQGPL